jgi:regulator of protease activity HflC (stomatin/prohibitin superfamily)
MLGVLVLGVGGIAALWSIYTSFRIDVPVKHVAVLIKKTGLDLENGEEVAPTPEHKGVQKELLSEGRYFRNPYYWQWMVIPQIEVPEGKLGVRIRLHGEDLGYAELIANREEEKGIVPEVMRPGRYAIHPYLEKAELHDPVTVSAGYKGVVTNLAGPLPRNPNRLLVEEGFRGVQAKTLDPGTYYVNPYMTRISLVDCRSQRLDLAETRDLGFPTKDGFWVSLDGIIEFRVMPDHAANVFVTYNEDANGEKIDPEIIRKVVMPNARSFCRLEGSKSLGREMIQGDKRTEFQEKFQTAMKHACEPLGIEIIQALITRIRPPERIAKPVRDREIAKQQESQYVHEIAQQESEKQLGIEMALIKQKQAIVRADQEVVTMTTEALQEQEVAVTKANENRGVARFHLDAARDEAEAILSRGRAVAEVVMFENAAEAAGWARSVEAYGGRGEDYARFVLFQKIAPAYRTIMTNTADSPIMKIFESFTPSGKRPDAASRPPAGDSN